MSDREKSLHALEHEGLVALLNRLYLAAREPELANSTARAMTDDELRDAIQTMRARIAAKDSPGSASSTIRQASTARQVRPASPGEGRRFCVLFTTDSALVSRAKAHLRTRGIPAIAVDSADTLAAVARQAMPTVVVIDARCGATRDITTAFGPRAFDVSIVECSDAASLLAAVHALAP
jgi:hypothetical protein